MKKVVLIGAGGYCSGVIDSLKKMNQYEIAGITDPVKKGTLCGAQILGTDDELERLYCEGIQYAHVTVGSIGDPSLRRKLVKKAKTIGFELISIIDPTSIISEFTTLGEMIYVAKNAVINSNVSIGNYCMINTGCIVEHGCILEDFVHIAPGAVVAGDVHIGENSHVGLNASILQGIHINPNVIIGAGSVVLGDVLSEKTVYGVVKG